MTKPNTVLERAGFMPARIPPIRSSDLDLAMACPRQYLFSRRYGFHNPSSYAEPLSLGSFVHLAFENRHKEDLPLLMSAAADRQIEATTFAYSESTSNPPTKYIKNDALKALAMTEAWLKVPLPTDERTSTPLGEWLDDPDYRVLFHEGHYRYSHPNWSRADIVVQWDRVVYNERTNRLWIDDYKTTAKLPSERALTCPFEFQTWHYIIALQHAVTSGVLSSYGVPSDATVGGMRHIILEKPNVTFGTKHVPFEYISAGKRKKMFGRIKQNANNYEVHFYNWDGTAYPDIGERGLMIQKHTNLGDAILSMEEGCGKKHEKHATSETPCPDIFRQDVMDRILFQGAYEDDLLGREGMEQRVAISKTFTSELTPEVREEYNTCVGRIYELATCPIELHRFPRNAAYMSKKGNPFVDLHREKDPANWVRILREGNFIQAWRDENDRPLTPRLRVED